MNRFISQFGNPSGAVGRILGGITAVSNRKMHEAAAADAVNFSRLLEIGFGSGAQLEIIAKKYHGKELFGIDISEDMLKTAQKKLGGTAELSFNCFNVNILVI